MPKQNWSTIIALVALLVSILSLWLQFRPYPDEVELISHRKPESSEKVRVSENSFHTDGDILPFWLDGLAWRATFYNPLDRPVVLTAVDVYYYESDGANLKDVLTVSARSADGKSYDQLAPVSLAPFAVESLLLHIRMPIAEPPEKCRSISSLNNLTKCVMTEGGLDLFGNEVNVDQIDDVLFVNWPNGNAGPNLKIVGQTADGSTFYFPIFYSESWILD